MYVLEAIKIAKLWTLYWSIPIRRISCSYPLET